MYLVYFIRSQIPSAGRGSGSGGGGATRRAFGFGSEFRAIRRVRGDSAVPRDSGSFKSELLVALLVLHDSQYRRGEEDQDPAKDEDGEDGVREQGDRADRAMRSRVPEGVQCACSSSRNAFGCRPPCCPPWQTPDRWLLGRASEFIDTYASTSIENHQLLQ